jgi:hypothetical protein
VKETEIFMKLNWMFLVITLGTSSFAEEYPTKPKINGLIQTWLLTDSSATAKNNFRARRAEIKLTGKITEKSRYFMMFDPAKSIEPSTGKDGKVIQDIGVGIGLNSDFEFALGQMKIPTHAEGLDSSADLPFPERSLPARTFGDKRQLGLQGIYKQKQFKVTGMLSNGNPPNQDDTTTAKDIHVRMDLSPWESTPELALGAYGGAGDFLFSSYGRWGFNLRWTGQSEFFRFEVSSADDSSKVKKTSQGYVAEVGYKLQPRLQPVFRHERLKPNLDNDFWASGVTFGANYFFAPQTPQALKLQAAYSFLYNMAGGNGSYKDLTTAPGRPARVFVVALQVLM